MKTTNIGAKSVRTFIPSLRAETRAEIKGVLRLVGRPMRLDEIAAACEIPVSSAFRHMSALQKGGEVRVVVTPSTFEVVRDGS